MANLVLNGISIDNIDDIAENFVEEDVLREFKSGSLASWLEEYGYEEELERVRSIKPTASSIRILSDIIDALNLDDGVIAQANARREEQQRKEEAVQKAREEQRLRNEEEHLRKEREGQQRKEQEEQQRQEEMERCQPREEKPVTNNESLNFDKVLKLAEQGDAEAQCNLGLCYGVTQDNDKAVRWFHKAAEQGLARAQCNLGLCYYNGTGVAEDKGKAVKWFRKAAVQGFADAQYNLGLYYYNGAGVAEDKSEAAKWFRKAAEQGHEDAQKALIELQSKPQQSTYYEEWLAKQEELLDLLKDFDPARRA